MWVIAVEVAVAVSIVGIMIWATLPAKAPKSTTPPDSSEKPAMPAPTNIQKNEEYE